MVSYNQLSQQITSERHIPLFFLQMIKIRQVSWRETISIYVCILRYSSIFSYVYNFITSRIWIRRPVSGYLKSDSFTGPREISLSIHKGLRHGRTRIGNDAPQLSQPSSTNHCTIFLSINQLPLPSQNHSLVWLYLGVRIKLCGAEGPVFQNVKMQ